ncbi:unnamed protein product [Danaus chrysippus]|uniref:(African queen) hypothetical protein n=1 Tax=Danaus chrysippus TaxID=151541 RepID=A0A8J2WBA0_9NEOP|nr:unnamed protein product [Danaus chrysippus]
MDRVGDTIHKHTLTHRERVAGRLPATDYRQRLSRQPTAVSREPRAELAPGEPVGHESASEQLMAVRAPVNHKDALFPAYAQTLL